MGLISPAQASDNVTAVNAAAINGPVNTIANEFNGNIDNANIKSGAAIDASKLADASIATAKLADSAVTPAKMSAVKLSGVGTSYTASPPAADGAFKMQAGTTVRTTNGSGDYTVTFPTAFSTGVLTIVACDGDDSGTPNLSVIAATVTTSQFSGSSNKASSTIRVNWIALGW